MNSQEDSTAERLILGNSCTVRTAEDMHALLTRAVADHSVLEIDCSAVEEADLSFVQLLLAARESARRAGHTLRLAQSATGALHDTLHRGGFLTATNTDLAFWLPN
ncbi:STAS domain-containing protein [Niveispirillum sp. KHB5.9]|uniref:STAS domain-containing protein n=1 Tax=Niveispirillum sp. KHB5.9 TaxID=3400269 RepID=UPI003A85B054